MKIRGLTAAAEAEWNRRSCAVGIIQGSTDTNEQCYYGMNKGYLG